MNSSPQVHCSGLTVFVEVIDEVGRSSFVEYLEGYKNDFEFYAAFNW